MSAFSQRLGAGLLRGLAAPPRRGHRRAGPADAPALVVEVRLEADLDDRGAAAMLRRIDAALARGAAHVRFDCRPQHAPTSATVAALVAAAKRLRRAGVTSELAWADARLVSLIDLHQVRAALAAASMRL